MTSLVDDYITDVIRREGGYVNDPADRGGPTRYGITEAVARAWGYFGPMHRLPMDVARAIYRDRYWTAPGFGDVARIDPAIADELFDTGVNMGTGVAATFLQRALNVLNHDDRMQPDLEVDGRIGRMTLGALQHFLDRRGAEGRTVLLRMLNGLQAARYIEIAEARPTQERFVYGWMRTRVT